MKKFKKLIAMGLTTVTALSIMSISTFAAETSANVPSDLTVIDNMIDYSIYDDDMVYIQEHADKVAEYNAAVLERQASSRAVSYVEWNWSNGIFSRTTGSASAYAIYYSFTPTSSYLYFNVDVTGSTYPTYMTVNKLNSNNTLTYVGSYYVDSVGNNNYSWDNYRRSLNAGQKYVFSLFVESSLSGTQSRWSSMSIDINNKSF